MSEEEKIEKQPTDNSTQPPENENIFDETIQPTTLNIQHNEENMEVHKHPHHVTHKKKWGEYLLEFFMLFLAVFLGFVAENVREHSVEKERAKQYIQSFYKDLLNDTAEYRILINEYDRVIKGLAARRECYQIIVHTNSSGCLQNLIRISQGFRDLITSDQTIQQLKNSGNFRLLPQADTDSIMLYDKMVRFFIKQETTGFQENIYNVRNNVYSLLSYEQSGKDGDTSKLLATDNKDLLNRFFNLLDGNAGRRQSNLNLLTLLNQKATSIIVYFKNKYQLQ